VGKPEGKKQLEKCRGIWKDNIKIDMISINRAENRDYWRALVKTVIDFRVP
jgi:hypothetical protein